MPQLVDAVCLLYYRPRRPRYVVQLVKEARLSKQGRLQCNATTAPPPPPGCACFCTTG
jgi:hypothetical protein